MNILVSGIGCISGIGKNVEETLRSLRENRSGIGEITLFPTRHKVPVSEVKYTNIQLKEYLGIDPKKNLSRTTLLGIVAAKEAYQDAGLSKLKKYRIGLISSTSTGGMDQSELFYPDFRCETKKGRLKQVIGHDAGDSTEHIADYLGIDGFRTTISTACSSAANAILLGARLIRSGMLDIVIAGGTDALCKFTLNGFGSLMLLDENPTRPFDESRSGLNLGEGAGFIVLQSAESLLRKPYCELAGAANSNDAYHQTASSSEGTGAWLSMKRALNKSISIEDISYINAHGTGTPNNDASESAALIRLFGNAIPSFSSTKPFTGHTLGAAGGIEAVLSVLSIHNGLRYPNLNFKTPIAEHGLIPQGKPEQDVKIKSVLSNSFGFGGNNASLLFHQVRKERNVSRGDKKKTPVFIEAIGSTYDIQTNESGNKVLSILDGPDKTLVNDVNLRRRMSRLIRMGVNAGLSCLQQAPDRSPDAIITATGLGFLADTEKFMNNLLDLEENLLPPTAFIQSTFNTVGAQIALLTKNHAYNTTYVHRGLSLESALIDAITLLQEKEARNVLCGAFDELTPTLTRILQRFRYWKNKKPGEGAAFFLLSNEKTERSYAEIKAIKTVSGKYSDAELVKIRNRFLEDNRINLVEVLYPEKWKNLCGDYPTAMSFGLWSTTKEMKNGAITCPVLICNSFLNDHSFILLNPV